MCLLEKLLKIKEVAEYYSVTTQAVYKWIKQGKIKTTTTPSGELRIKMSSIVGDDNAGVD